MLTVLSREWLIFGTNRVQNAVSKQGQIGDFRLLSRFVPDIGVFGDSLTAHGKQYEPI